MVNFLIVVSPLAALCWILPETQGYARNWIHAFVGSVFSQFLMVLALALSAGMLGASELTAGRPAEIGWLVGIAGLLSVFVVARLVGGDHSGGGALAAFTGFTAARSVAERAGEAGRFHRGKEREARWTASARGQETLGRLAAARERAGSGRGLDQQAQQRVEPDLSADRTEESATRRVTTSRNRTWSAGRTGDALERHAHAGGPDASEERSLSRDAGGSNGHSASGEPRSGTVHTGSDTRRHRSKTDHIDGPRIGLSGEARPPGAPPSDSAVEQGNTHPAGRPAALARTHPGDGRGAEQSPVGPIARHHTPAGHQPDNGGSDRHNYKLALRGRDVGGRATSGDPAPAPRERQ